MRQIEKRWKAGELCSLYIVTVLEEGGEILNRQNDRNKRRVVVNLPLPETELARAVATRLVRKSGMDITLQMKIVEPDKAICKLTLRE